MFRYILPVILSLANLLQAQDVKSLKIGEAIPSNFRAYLVNDDRFEKGSPRNRPRKMHDLVSEYGLNPVLAAFSRTAPAADTPVEKLALEMGDLVAEFKAQRLGSMMIFLTLDNEFPAEDNTDKKAEKKAETVDAFWRHLDGKMPVVDDAKKEKRRVGVPMGLAPKTAAASWGLGIEDLIVVYYDRMTVKKTWSFTAEKPLTAEDIKSIRSTVESELKPKR